MNDSNDTKVKNGSLENFSENEKSRSSEDVNTASKNADLKTFLEDSLGQLYLSLCYLSSNRNGNSMNVLFPEEKEYNNLDKSIEELDEVKESGAAAKNDASHWKEDQVPTLTSPTQKKRPCRLDPFDRFTEINPKNQELLRLSLRLNGNRPNTPTLRYGTSSNYSDADSGIGTTTPTKRISDLATMASFPWTRMHPEMFDDILGSPRINRNTLTTRSNRSYNFENESPTRKTASLKSNRSLDIDNFFLNRLSPTTEFKNFDVASLQSLTIPMGSSDGRKIIKRSVTSPEDLQNLNNKSFEYDFSSRNSLQRSLTISLDHPRMPRRIQWANKAQFILACVGYSIGLGNIWRFPYVCYKSGGGAFLVPYILALLVCGVPLLYMELTIGQLTKRGPIGALGKLCPLLKGEPILPEFSRQYHSRFGAGLSSVVISFIMSTYYNVIIAYTIYYLFTSLNSKLPWQHCDNPWNTINCWMPSLRYEQNISKPNMSRSPSQEFYDNKVLQITSGLESLGKFRWELVACLIVAWILVYFSIWKSIKSSGKVIYITATLPYVIILAFLVRSVTLEGADVGLSYLFNPQWNLLGDAKIWVNAAAQVFNSIGLAFGSIISFSSYKKANDKILVDTIIVSCINAGTSLLVGIFAFAIIGNIATEHRTSVHDVITDGPGLVFVVYPEAMAKMPASQLWAILFFMMLFCLGLNSQFAIVEVVVTAIQDGFPNWIRRNFGGHEVLVLAVCFVSFVLGLPNVFQGGIFFFQLIDHYAASISIMYLSFFELIAISWFYGYRRLRNNLKEMTGETPSWYFRFCWCIAAPVFIMAVWIFSLIDYEPPTYRNGEYRYPPWAEGLGWGIASMSLACIPVFSIYVYFSSEGDDFMQKIKNALTPHLYVCDICNEDHCEHVYGKDGSVRELDTLLKENGIPTVVNEDGGQDFYISNGKNIF